MAICSPLQTTSLRRILPKFTLIAFLSFVCCESLPGGGTRAFKRSKG